MRKKPKSSKIHSQSADLIGGNEYLLGKILPCLPVQSLIRFQIVSKQWHSLISDPRFGLNHTLENPVSRIPSGLFFRDSLAGAKTFDSVSISKSGCNIPSLYNPVVLPEDVPHNIRNLLPQSISMEIKQSCNGLILFEFKSSVPHINLYCVRNIVTKQQRFVPLPKFEGGRPPEVTCLLVFDPLVSPHYKLVGFKHMPWPGSKFLIFSSETGQWKHTNVTVSRWTVENAKGVYCNGSLYWIPIVFYRISECNRFHVEAKRLTTILMPRRPGTADNSYLRYFGGFNGRLNVVYVRNVSAKKFNVLELDEVTQKWFIKYRVHLNRLISPFPEIVVNGTKYERSKYAFSILSVTQGEKNEDSAFIMTVPGKVVSYNFRVPANGNW